MQIKKIIDSTVHLRFGFPEKIPVILKGKKLGHICVNFIYDKRETKYEKIFPILVIKNELNILVRSLNKYFNLAIDLASHYDRTYPLTTLLVLFSGRKLASCFLTERKLIDDEEIFSLIKSGGEAALHVSFVRAKINDWLSDGEIANSKLSKVKNCLLEHSLGPSFNILPLKGGRPKSQLLAILGMPTIKNAYHELSSILGIIKKGLVRSDSGQIDVLFHKAFLSFKERLEQEIKKQPDSREIKEKIERFERYMFLTKGKRKLLADISKCIQNDEDLRTHFNSFKWEPNKFAIEVLSKLLSVSKYSIESLLYRKKDLSKP